MITVQKLSPRDEVARRLIAALDEYQSALYPPESNHLDSVEELDGDDVCLWALSRMECCGGVGR